MNAEEWSLWGVPEARGPGTCLLWCKGDTWSPINRLLRLSDYTKGDENRNDPEYDGFGLGMDLCKTARFQAYVLSQVPLCEGSEKIKFDNYMAALAYVIFGEWAQTFD